MNKSFLLSIVLLFQLAGPGFMAVGKVHTRNSEASFDNLSAVNIRVSRPLYVNLEATQDGSLVLWEAIPQSIQYHVATIDLDVLSIFISSNAGNIQIYRDEVGNLWLAINYTVLQGEFISTLMWVSSEITEENLTVPNVIPFPDHYPATVESFLKAGRKMPTNDEAIKELAALLTHADMVSTIKSIVHFINETQTYDSEKIRLLMSGELKTGDVLDFLNDPLESLETNMSFCFERAILATTLLRAANIPARTFTNADLKTWVEVWLPEIGWVHAEVLCQASSRDLPLFPRPLSFATIPLMIQNSSDTLFPFTWHPRMEMRIANLTLTDLSGFKMSEYGTVLCQPIDSEKYAADSDKFKFPLFLGTKEVQAALTLDGEDLTFHLDDGKKTAIKKITLGEKNHLEFAGFVLSFQPTMQAGLLIFQEFSINESQMFDFRILFFLIIPVPFVLGFWLYWKRRKP